MKIKRTINGIEYEFELTAKEMYDVYFDRQYVWDREFVKDEYRDRIEDICSTQEEYKDFVEDVVREMRRQMNEYDFGQGYAAEEAFEIIKERRKKYDARS